MKVAKNLDNLVHVDLGVPTHPAEPDCFGVEVEVEGKGLFIRNNKETTPYWSIGEDGSLRRLMPDDQALEYKFRIPLNMYDTEAALRVLQARLTEPGVQVYPSPRCSVHVHVNMAKETVRTLYNFLCLSFIFEEVFVDLNGKDRAGNNFCLRAKDAEGTTIGMTQAMRDYGSVLTNINQESRYCATNLCSLYRFQTIEFRSLEFTIDQHRIMAWIKTLQAVKEAARRFRDPVEIIEQFSLKGPRRFFLDCMGIVLGSRYLAVERFEQKLWDGVGLIQEFAYCAQWPAAGAIKKEPEVKKDHYKEVRWGQVPAGQPGIAQGDWGINPQAAQPAVAPMQFNRIPETLAQIDAEMQRRAQPNRAARRAPIQRRPVV